MDINTLMIIIPVIGVIGLLFTVWKSAWVSKQEEGTGKMVRIGQAIREGAMAFLSAEYKVLAIFVVVVAVLLGWSGATSENSSILIVLSFILGAFSSGLAGFIGM